MREVPSRARYAVWRIGAGYGIDWAVRLSPDQRELQLNITRTIHILAGERTPVGYGYAFASWYDFGSALVTSQIEWARPDSKLPDGEY